MGKPEKVTAYVGLLTASRAVLVSAVLAIGSVVPPALAQDDAHASQVHFGKMTYRLFCVGCHGDDGRGDGAVARSLEMPLSDLTRISERNDGTFPAEEVADSITGLGETRGHRGLPVGPWTEMFAEEFEMIAERAIANQMVARRIAHLVAYLESIQR